MRIDVLQQATLARFAVIATDATLQAAALAVGRKLAPSVSHLHFRIA